MRVARRTEPTEVVIWSSASLLGILVGVAAAFGLWSGLRRTSDPQLLTLAVVSLSAGFGLVGSALRSLPARLFLLALAAALAVAFFMGGSAFAGLSA
jgi:uncharacterized membrane protein YccC